jgi:hypothetical protein
MMNTDRELPRPPPSHHRVADHPLRHALLHVLALIGAGIGGVALAED